ncbi:MAG TPA: zinc ribbon domain-containing protein [Acidobacteriota bacterium]|nr:zinc ribbon domain-containing protein [Acidobacteriota bacterium]
MKRERFDLGREIRVVPRWSIIVALLLFVGTQFVFFRFLWPSEQNPPPLALQIAFTTLAASALAFLVLMVGYVNRDAGRRGMSRTLWTLLVIFIPNAIGFIIYFLVRNPLRVQCPQCGAVIEPSVNFCPSCRFALRPTCPQCKSAINPGDRFCPKCGRELSGMQAADLP